MKKLLITGGARLSGTVRIHGAKNSVLPVLAACCLCTSPCVLHNCPDIEDVRTALAILESLGCKTRREGSTLCIDPSGLSRFRVEKRLAGKMRSSILFLGALLARCGEAELALPGGCPLGERPIDLHVKSLAKLGARFRFEKGILQAAWRERRDGDIFLSIPSVGATENLLLACALGSGTVTLHGAAREPEITDLIGFLRAAGADIRGAGAGDITIRGVKKLHGATYTILPDRIETATYLCMAAGCGGDVALRRCDGRLLAPVIGCLREAGCEIRSVGSEIALKSSGKLTAVSPVTTAPYPGFPTDLQSALLSAMTVARGKSEIEENIFEARFQTAAQLRRMGADLEIKGNRALIRGVSSLHGTFVRAKELRGGAALVLAALGAEGTTLIQDDGYIERGYEDLLRDLGALGACMQSSTVKTK